MGATAFRQLLMAAGLVLLTACSSPQQRAEAHYQSGLKLMAESDYIRAALEFRNAVRYDPGAVDAWSKLAAVEERNGRPDAVAEALQHVVELAPGRDADHEKLARLLLGGNDLSAALDHVNAALGVRKGDAGLFALRAAIDLRRNDSDAARQDAARALEIDPKSAEAEAVLATDLLVRGNRGEASQHVRRGLESDPKNAGLLLLDIKIRESDGDDKSLEAALRALVAAHPDFPQARQSLAAFLVSRHRYQEAEVEFRGMVAAAPDDIALGIAFARFLHDARDAAASRRELERIAAAHPESPDVVLALAQLDYAGGDVPAASARLAKLIADPASPEAVSRARLLLASIQVKQGDTAGAAENVKAVLDGDGRNADALALRAELRLAAGDTDNAIADIRAALSEAPQSAPLLTMLAQAEERAGQSDLAVGDYASALKASGNAPAVAYKFAAFLDRRARSDQADRMLEEALAARPGNSELLVAIAERKLNQGDWAGAERLAGELERAGAAASAMPIRGAALAAQGKLDESIALFKRAHDASPQDALALNNLVMAYAKAGKTAEAEDLLSGILQDSPDNVAALVLKGMLLKQRGERDEAGRLFQQAIDRSPQDPAAYLALAGLRSDDQRFAESEALLKRAHGAIPADLGISLALAALLERRGDADGAIAVYEQQLAATPDELVVVNNLASLIAENRTDATSLDRAGRLAARLSGIDVPQFKDTLGWIAFHRGNLAEAEKLLTDAVRAPGLAAAHYHLGMTYQALKRLPDAEDQFRAADAQVKDDDPLKKRIAAARQSMLAKSELRGG